MLTLLALVLVGAIGAMTRDAIKAVWGKIKTTWEEEKKRLCAKEKHDDPILLNKIRSTKNAQELIAIARGLRNNNYRIYGNLARAFHAKTIDFIEDLRLNDWQLVYLIAGFDTDLERTAFINREPH